MNITEPYRAKAEALPPPLPTEAELKKMLPPPLPHVVVIHEETTVVIEKTCYVPFLSLGLYVKL